MDRVLHWFDRNSISNAESVRLELGFHEMVRMHIQAATAPRRELLQNSTSENIYSKNLNVLLSGHKQRDVASTSSSSPSSCRGISGEVSDQALDSSLWSKLPESIIPLILAFLPIQSLAKCRLVCKRWHSLWNDSKFLSLRVSHAPEEKSWFIFNCHHTTTCISYVHTICFNPVLNRWHTMNLGSMSDPRNTSLIVVATSGGLMLCAAYDTTSFSSTGDGLFVQTSRSWISSTGPSIEWFVCNPLRENCWVKLPEKPLQLLENHIQIELHGIPRRQHHISSKWPMFTSACLIADPDSTNSFQVVLGTPQTTEVYDSSTGCWKLLVNSVLPHRLATASTRTISYKGCLLSVGVSKVRINNSVCSVVFYDPENERWSELSLPATILPKKILSIQLEDCEDRLLLLVHMGPWTNAWSSTSVSYNAATPNPLDFEDSRLCVWEFVGEDLSSGVWHEVCSHLLQEIRDLAVNVEGEEGAKLLAATSGKELLCCTLTDPILSQSVQLLYCPFYNTWLSVEERFADEHVFCSITDFPEPNIRFQPRLEASVSLQKKTSKAVQ